MDDDALAAEVERWAAEPLDDLDLATLAAVRAAAESVDPVPAGLTARVTFALALEHVFAEVAEVTRVPLEALSGARAEAAGTRTETLTFSAARLTAMVTVSRVGTDRLRLDGWLAPAGPCLVRLRVQVPPVDPSRPGPEWQTVADEDGRFSFEGLAEGFAQLSFQLQPGPADDHATDHADDHPRDADLDAGTTVVTPVFQL